MAPRYACEAFVTVDDVLAATCGCEYTEVDDGALIADYIDEASDMLYVLSGGRVFGLCTRQVWPISIGGGCGGGGMYDQSWVNYDSVDSIPLGRPNTEIIEVTIDGVALNPSEYGLLDGYKLFRRSGSWPSSNDITKDDSEVGTFTITYRFGEATRAISKRATIELVCQMMRGSSAGVDRLRGIVSANVQGVSVQMDPDAIAEMGLPEVNRFLDFHAPRGIGSLAWYTPEMDHGWHLATVTGGSGS